jgi:hypothetical protein
LQRRAFRQPKEWPQRLHCTGSALSSGNVSDPPRSERGVDAARF